MCVWDFVLNHFYFYLHGHFGGCPQEAKQGPIYRLAMPLMRVQSANFAIEVDAHTCNAACGPLSCLSTGCAPSAVTTTLSTVSQKVLFTIFPAFLDRGRVATYSLGF
jgi:hypothetical protein